jgi:hypothetical protein
MSAHWLMTHSPDQIFTLYATTAARGPGVLMPSTPSAYPQVTRRRFASFRVVKSSVSAGRADFWDGFDSRQLHTKMLVRAIRSWPAFFCV